MSDTVQQVKERIDIADFLRGYLTLFPAGKNLKAVCPFHKEKTPSFSVSPDRQIWHCFGCGAGGDVIAFLMRYENIEFFEALKILAEKAGLDIRRVGGPDQRDLNVLYEINRSAKEFFKSNLAAIDQYLKSRGLKTETISEFEIGFTGNVADGLTRHLLNKSYSVGQIEKAGLVFKTERGTYIDRFRNRIMFPIHNGFGKPVGFTGRILPNYENENVGKYVNSPETPIFNKSKLLYGIDKTKNAIRDSRIAVLVEGQMDLLMAWQDGVKNAVATSGTALTSDHLRNLKRIADNLVVSFDQDEAGQLAVEKAIDLAGANDITAKVLTLPSELKAKDPADIALAKPGLLSELVVKARSAMDFYFSRYKVASANRGEIGIGDLKKNIRAVLTKIKNLSSPIERSQWLKELANRSGIDERYLTEELDSLRVPSSPEKAEDPPPESPRISRKDLISQRIVTLAISGRNLYETVTSILELLPVAYRNIAEHYCDGKALSADLRSLADLVNLRTAVETDDPKNSRKELTELIRQLKLEVYKERRQVLLADIRQAEQTEGDATTLLAEFQKISEEINNL
ncbi:MAG: DNA primase [Candidatus Harrisonbacteria bacterium]|nr:DNA primase [Candidatus Harrisonbacteria bacterium]